MEQVGGLEEHCSEVAVDAGHDPVRQHPNGKKHGDPQHIDKDAALNGDGALTYCNGTLQSVTDRIPQATHTWRR